MANVYDQFAPGSKRTGSPYASKSPVNDLDSLLDHYFGSNAPDDFSFAKGYVDPEYNHEDPKADLY